MTIKSSGQLSFSEIIDEFGSANSISMSQYYSLDEGIPNRDDIKFSNFYAKTINSRRTLGGTIVDFNARNDFANSTIIGYKSHSQIVDNNKPLKYYISSGGVVGSSGVTTSAFDTGNWPSGTKIYLTNDGYIVGAGGSGGSGGVAAGASRTLGTQGGNALILRTDTFITNNGSISGGGGGGNGGTNGSTTTCIQEGCCYQNCYTVYASGGGGGGGAGYTVGLGGAGGSGALNGSNGTFNPNGTSMGGLGGNGQTATSPPLNPAYGGNGGNGGGLGQSSNDGAGSGNYIVNARYATWVTVGIRTGGVLQ